MNKYILILRMQSYFTNNFNVKICAVYKNNKLYKIYKLYSLIYCIIPFYILSYLFYLFGYQIIYMTNNIYNITYTNQIHIIPIILKFNIINDNITYDLTNSIKKYSSSIPFKFVIKQNNIKKYNKLEIIILQNGKKKCLELELIDINIPIYKLFLSLDTE
jgi:hypothetical protein